MERKSLSIPEIAIISGTRAALGAGLGLLAGEYLSREQRRAVGWSLLGVGVISSIPIAMQLFGSSKSRGETPGDRVQEQTRRLTSSERRASGSRDAHGEDSADAADMPRGVPTMAED